MRRVTVAGIAFFVFILWVGISGADYALLREVYSGNVDYSNLSQLRLGITDMQTMETLRYATLAMFLGWIAFTVWAVVADRKQRRERSRTVFDSNA